MSKLACFLQCHEPTEGKVNRFTSEKVTKVQEKLSIRQKLKIKYANLDLSTATTETVGYHSRCFDNFNNIKAANLKKYEEICRTGTFILAIEI